MGPGKGNCYGLRAGLAGLVVLFFALVAGGAGAETPSPPPAGMTQQQYDDLVKSVGQSVLKTLTDKGLVASTPASPAAAQPGGLEEEVLVAERVVMLLGEVPRVLGGYSDVATDLAQL